MQTLSFEVSGMTCGGCTGSVQRALSKVDGVSHAEQAICHYREAHGIGGPLFLGIDTPGLSGDMRHLHEAAASNRDARMVIEMFCCSVHKQAAAKMAVLGRLDMRVFTGGIGENETQVRAEICTGLACIGVSLDESRNGAANNPVSDGASRGQGLCSRRGGTSRSPAMPGLCSPGDSLLHTPSHRRRQRLGTASLSARVIPMLALLEKS